MFFFTFIFFIFFYIPPQDIYTNMILYGKNRLSYAQVHELPQSNCVDNREGTLFLGAYIICQFYCLTFVRFEQFFVADHLWPLIYKYAFYQSKQRQKYLDIGDKNITNKIKVLKKRVMFFYNFIINIKMQNNIRT